MAQMQVFVSHSHEDEVFCQAIVDGLRGAGADVWYDEHNLGSGQLMEVIQRELGRRPVVILILSRAAFASRWVRREITWAYEMLDRDPSRLLLPVTASSIAREDFDPNSGWLFLHDFKRIEANGYQPYSTDEATRRLLHALALVQTRDASAGVPSLSIDNITDFVAHGQALIAQHRHIQAIPFLEAATKQEPNNFSAWFNLGFVYNAAERWDKGEEAYRQAVHLDGQNAAAWYNWGVSLRHVARPEEALVAFDHTLALDPTRVDAWNGRGNTLSQLGHFETALLAYDTALRLEPHYAPAIHGKFGALYSLGRFKEAAEVEHAVFQYINVPAILTPSDLEKVKSGLDSAPPDHSVRRHGVERTAEAEAAERRAKELGG